MPRRLLMRKAIRISIAKFIVELLEWIDEYYKGCEHLET